MAEAVDLGIPGVEDAVLVGQGGFGAVYRARQTRFQRDVAVKVLTGRHLDEAAQARFERECAAMGSLSGHPHIVTVFDSGVAGDRPYLVMEYLPGGSLLDRLQASGRLPWEEVGDVGVKLAGALESAHRGQVLHRDVKPDNVLVNAWGEPQLADFGIARVAGAYETATGEITATLVHAAPELLEGAPPSVASDVYGLASTLFELLHGRPAFAREGEESIVPLLARVTMEDPPDLRPVGVPDPVCAAVEAAMAKDPAARPPTVEAFGVLLQEAQRATGQPVTRMMLGPAAPATVTSVPPAGAARATSPVEAFTGPPSLLQQVRGLLDEALGACAGTPVAERVAAIRARLDEPLRVAIAGKVKAGKSTLLNALIGEELAPTDAGECTRVVTWYCDGVTYRATVHPVDGPARQIPFTRSGGALELDLGLPAEDVDRLVVEWPSSSLQAMTLIDTPGVASVTATLSARAESFLAGDEGEEAADAIVYLMRHVHPADIRVLEAFHDDELAHPTPVNAVGVLSRADELGVGRPDALDAAARVAARYRQDPKIRRLCQTVVPVAGLLAQSAATLREDEYRALAALAALPREAGEDLLVSSDRFVGDRGPLAVDPDTRRALVGRFGLFGVRLAMGLVADGSAPSASRLSAELLARSGLPELRQVLLTQFASRRDVLKARAALEALAHLLATEQVAAADHLGAQLERITAGAHELVELRLLNALRAGGTGLREAEQEEAERLLGGGGLSPVARLGLPADSGPAELRAALTETVARWQRRAENPLSSRQVSEAARVLVRTCEGMLAGLPPG